MRKYVLAGAATLAMASGAQAGELTTGSGAIFNRAEPGKAIVRIDAAVVTMFGFGSSTNDKAQVGGVSVKNDPYAMIMYARMYPAFDAQTTGGLRYGGFMEIRTNSTATSGASRSGNTLFMNRAYGYLGGDSWGRIAFGQVDGVLGLMNVGTFQGFADGGLNGSAPGLIANSDNYIWRFPFSQGAEYQSMKFSYTSPKFAGFDFGLSFVPNTSSHAGGDIASVSAAGSGRAVNSAFASDANRFRNQYQVIGRYTGNLGPVGLAATVGYQGSGKVSVAGAGNARRGLSNFDTGVQLSYMGFSVGGHYTVGQFNGALNLSAPGEKTAQVWLIGAQYSTGPWTAGVHYLNSKTPGVFGAGTGMLKEYGVGAGVTYAWAPGVRTFVEFVYHNREESGRNLQVGTGPAKSNVNGTAIVLGQAFRW